MRLDKKDQGPPDIRIGVWLAMLGVVVIMVITVSFPRERPVQESTERSVEMASTSNHSPFAKTKRVSQPTTPPPSGYADEIDAIDYSIINDRSRWVDPTFLQ
jgi:hypothetical protein